MTLDEFFTLYAAAHAVRPFRILPGGTIRDADGVCPVCAVGRMRGLVAVGRDWKTSAVMIGSKLGLQADVCDDLQTATDTRLVMSEARGDEWAWSVNRLRDRLLMVAGLSELAMFGMRAGMGTVKAA